MAVSGAAERPAIVVSTPEPTAVLVPREPAVIADQQLTLVEEGRGRGTLTVDGLQRSFEVFLPADVDGPVPLVVALPGFSQDIDRFLEMSSIDEAAGAGGFAVLVGEGVDTSWNGGAQCCGTALRDDVDDVAFVRAAVTMVTDRVDVDTDAIVATGFSNGGYLTNRLVCEASDLFSGFVVVAGLLAVDDCTPAEPVVILHLHGARDPLVPVASGIFSFERWVDLLGCSGTDDAASTSTLRAEDGVDCDPGMVVELRVSASDTHTWLREDVDANAELTRIVRLVQDRA